MSSDERRDQDIADLQAGGRQRSQDIAELNTNAERLLEQVVSLAGGTGNTIVRLAEVAKSNRRMIITLFVSVSLDVVLTALLALGFVALHNTSNQVSTVTTRLDEAQTVQRQKALCPLYSLLLSSDTAAARAKSPNPVQFDKDFTIISEGFNALHCSDFTGGPPTLGK